jgi:hypothetical protein
MGVLNTKSGLFVDGVKISTVGGEGRDKEDDKSIRHGLDRNDGFDVGAYMQPPPILFSNLNHNLFLGDMYKGAACFLICGGPSLIENDLNKLNNPGIVTMGINNSAAVFRPNMWICVDNPQNFLLSIWNDPKIQKFTPICHKSKKLFDNNAYREVNKQVQDCPNVVYYTRNEKFQAKQFLVEDSVNWGNHSLYCDCGYKKPSNKTVKVCPKCQRDNFWGSRTVMLAAMRIMFYLGFRRVYLVGADFKMEEGKGYAFKQDRSKQSIKNNNNTYRILNKRFDDLKPEFEKYNYQVFNCYKDSGLKTFPYISFEDAIKRETIFNTDKENTEGLYDRKAKEKEKKKEKIETTTAKDKEPKHIEQEKIEEEDIRVRRALTLDTLIEERK